MPDVKIFYRKDSNYSVVPVSGVWGGLTPQGFLHCDLFLEKNENPESITMEITDDGDFKEKAQHPAKKTFIRDLMVGAYMRPEVARAIGQWLINKADEWDKTVGKSG